MLLETMEKFGLQEGGSPVRNPKLSKEDRHYVDGLLERHAAPIAAARTMRFEVMGNAKGQSRRQVLMALVEHYNALTDEVNRLLAAEQVEDDEVALVDDLRGHVGLMVTVVQFSDRQLALLWEQQQVEQELVSL